MPYLLIAVLLLAGCGADRASGPSHPIDCPASVPVPAPLVGKPTIAKVSALQIRGELAREAERARGDACAAAVEAMREWMRK